ncbi:hypothetical protein ACU686_40355 [Yinghuangia aomiensis]
MPSDPYETGEQSAIRRRQQLAAVAAGHRAADPEALTARRRPVAELTAAIGRNVPDPE